MAINLDENQVNLVSLKRLPPEQRPKYYNASTGDKVRISEDFEAFLILQGRPRNKETVSWLTKASDFAIQDADRDSLINTALENEQADAETCSKELAPVTEQFTKFRERYNMTGFEGVSEAGRLLSDLQRPMSEIITLGTRHTHRQVYAKMLSGRLSNNGLTSDASKQLNSWFESLTTY
jgi:hypothetical protein